MFSPHLLLFIIIQLATTEKFMTGWPWELLYADNLVLIAEPIVELEEKMSSIIIIF